MIKIGKYEYLTDDTANARMQDLRDLAITRLLNNTFFNIDAWLNEEEYHEYKTLNEAL